MSMAKVRPAREDNRAKNTRMLLVLLILLLVVLLCGLLYVLRALTTAPETEPVLSGVAGVELEFQAFGGGALGAMELPFDVAFDGSTTIYVTVPDEGTVLAFDKNGRSGRVFVEGHQEGDASVADYDVLAPTGIDVGDNGIIYVADRKKMAVVAFNEDGDKLSEFPIMAPKAVEVTNGRMYVISDTGTLFVTDLEGNALGQWGTNGRGQDQLAGAFGVAVDGDGNIYISDLDNYRVTSLTPELERRWQLGEPADISTSHEQSREFSAPAGITLGADGNLYLVDGLNSQVRVISPDGASVSLPLGEHGVNDDQFFFPKGIEWMDEDLFVIADSFHARVVGVRLTPQPTEGAPEE